MKAKKNSNKYRIIRGSSFDRYTRYLPSIARYWDMKEDGNGDFGFRLVIRRKS